MKYKNTMPGGLPITPKTDQEASDYLNSLCESDISNRSMWNRYQGHRGDGKSVKDSCSAAINERKKDIKEIDKIMIPGSFPQTIDDINEWIIATFEAEMAKWIKDCFFIDCEMSDKNNIELSLIRSINAALNDGRKARAEEARRNTERELTIDYLDKNIPKLINLLSETKEASDE